jgi:methyl-accepting chemotaxis protein
VRALAQRSAQAAKDIKALISTSTDQIGGGVSLVESSGDALRQIVGEVSAVSDLVNQIAEAAEKQATGIAEISDIVSSMDKFTQQNAAMVEQTSAGTRNLSEETLRLMERLRRFSVDPAPNHAAPQVTWRDAGTPPERSARPPAPRALPRSNAAAMPAHSPAFAGNTALRRDPAPALAAPAGDNWSEF